MRIVDAAVLRDHVIGRGKPEKFQRIRERIMFGSAEIQERIVRVKQKGSVVLHGRFPAFRNLSARRTSGGHDISIIL